jgi:hypothetical protein
VTWPHYLEFGRQFSGIARYGATSQKRDMSRRMAEWPEGRAAYGSFPRQDIDCVQKTRVLCKPKLLEQNPSPSSVRLCKQLGNARPLSPGSSHTKSLLAFGSIYDQDL